MSRKIKQWSRTEIELIDKDIRTDIKEILNVQKKGGRKHKHNEKRESYKKAQIKLLKMKNTVFEMKNSLDGINSRLNTKEKEISGFLRC